MNKRTTPSSASIVGLLAQQMADQGARELLFRIISERIRSRQLDAEEAAVIAKWFDRMGAGEDVRTVLAPQPRGRPKGSLRTKIVSGKQITRPDDVTLAWTMRDAIDQHGEDEIFKAVAKRFGMTEKSVANLYRRIIKLIPRR